MRMGDRQESDKRSDSSVLNVSDIVARIQPLSVPLKIHYEDFNTKGG